MIYAGSLVNPQLLAMTKPDCRIFNSAYMDIEDVLAEICRAEEQGEMTVRLHTGDTTLYSTIHEQIEELEKIGISYDVTAGVSAFQAAAASLHAELTIPAITQSVILTRGSGRTKVPERESIRSFAAHQATMALYLSASLAEEVQQELLAGGYRAEVPVAVVYKASWEEEKIIRSTVGDFAAEMAREEIHKTAVILVGEVLRCDEASDADRAERSRLYDRAFTTGYRLAKDRTVWMCACTMQGAAQMKHLAALWAAQRPELSFSLHVKCKEHPENEAATLKELAAEAFPRVDAMVFFAAAGIAVRAVAHCINSKVTDPAVLSVDEGGNYCIPLLSGHLGGANDYAKQISALLGTQPVITTATDIEGRFAVDVFAKKNDLWISDMKKAKEISAAIVSGREISVFSTAPIDGDLPIGVRWTQEMQRADLIISDKVITEKTDALLLYERTVDVGIGCRKGTDKEQILAAIDDALQLVGLDRRQIHAISSIDLKQEEAGLWEAARLCGTEPRFFTAEELNAQEGSFSTSDFVKATTGVDCVCERAAVAASGGLLKIQKRIYENVTIALAQRDVKLHWQ